MKHEKLFGSQLSILVFKPVLLLLKTAFVGCTPFRCDPGKTTAGQPHELDRGACVQVARILRWRRLRMSPRRLLSPHPQNAQHNPNHQYHNHDDQTGAHHLDPSVLTSSCGNWQPRVFCSRASCTVSVGWRPLSIRKTPVCDCPNLPLVFSIDMFGHQLPAASRFQDKCSNGYRW